MNRASSEVPFYDVFLSCSARDAALGEVVKRKFGDAGLSVFSDSAVNLERDLGAADKLREALMESSAFVALLTPSNKDSPALTFEVGAAWGKQMPIHVLVEDKDADVPSYLRQHEVCPLTRLPELIAAIAEVAKPLTESQRTALIEAYSHAGVPVDSLLTRPAALADIAAGYHRLTGRKMPGNHLARELLRLRKQGKLPRVRN